MLRIQIILELLQYQKSKVNRWGDNYFLKESWNFLHKQCRLFVSTQDRLKNQHSYGRFSKYPL